jgi:hypothetical protein
MAKNIDKPLTRSRALIHAAKYGLQREVAYLIDHRGYTPEEALSEWDIL